MIVHRIYHGEKWTNTQALLLGSVWTVQVGGKHLCKEAKIGKSAISPFMNRVQTATRQDPQAPEIKKCLCTTEVHSMLGQLTSNSEKLEPSTEQTVSSNLAVEVQALPT